MTKSNEEIINEMQQVVQQMVIDDLEENPDIANDFFDCDRLCNDCVLLAETGFALGIIKDIQDLMDAMEDKRLEELCKFIKDEEVRKTQMEN